MRLSSSHSCATSTSAKMHVFGWLPCVRGAHAHRERTSEGQLFSIARGGASHPHSVVAVCCAHPSRQREAGDSPSCKCPNTPRPPRAGALTNVLSSGCGPVRFRLPPERIHEASTNGSQRFELTNQIFRAGDIQVLPSCPNLTVVLMSYTKVEGKTGTFFF